MSDRVILVGTLPPPFDGQSVAFKVVSDYLKNTGNEEVKIVNISGSKKRSNKVLSNLLRAFDYSFVITKISSLFFKGYRILYLQIAQSRRGFLRDRVIINIAHLFNCKIILHLHGGNYDGFYNSLDKPAQQQVRSTLVKAEKIIILSRNLLGMFDFEPSLKSKLISIPNGVGYEKLDEEGKKIKSEKGEITILYLSNLIETKGYLHVLESIKILVEDYNLKVKAFFCGRFLVNSDQSSFKTEKEAKDDFFNKIEQYGLQETVKYEGVVTGEAKQRMLDKAHFFILPTKYKNEGQPISIIEAMRAGCVVITTNYRAMPEMIEDKKNGILLDKVNPCEIAEIINNLFKDSSKFESLSLNAIKTYNFKFTERIHCKAISQVLNQEQGSNSKLTCV